MMKVLKKKDLYKILDRAKERYQLILPKKYPSGDILFEESGPVEELPDDYVLSYNSLKDFFFPQSEVLLPEEKNKREKKLLFFGVRSCDIKALHFQDLFFSREPQDAYYLDKCRRSLVISVSCNRPAKSCFCLFTQSGPYLEAQDNFDLQFTPLHPESLKDNGAGVTGFTDSDGEEYFVEAGNEKGRDFISSFGEFFREGSPAQAIQNSLSQNRCKMKIEQAYDMAKIERKLNHEGLLEFWQELGQRCTNCGGCEFICPTCFCFNLQDECRGGKMQRIRSWDSCTYEGYSRLAGGFNPYYKRGQRIKKRFYCKLYHAKMWFGMYGCVGCGRCTAVCPVNLEMESFISSFMEGNTYQSLLKEI